MPRTFSTPLRFPILLALATLLLAWVLTAVSWNLARETALESQNSEFDSMVDNAVERISRRFGVYEQILRASRGFLRNSIVVSSSEYRAFVENLNLDTYFPGIQGIGLTEVVQPEDREEHEARMAGDLDLPEYRIWPSGRRSIYTAIIRLEPLDAMNRRALGYDMYSDPVRRRAMARARDSGSAALTGKVRLVQEGMTDVQPGFLIYLPVYAPDMPTDTEAQRRAALRGWIYGPFRMNDFIRGLGGVLDEGLQLTVYDGNSATPAACMFGCNANGVARSAFSAQRTVEYGGRTWLLEMHSTPEFDQQLDRTTPALILAGGLLTGALLAALVLVLATGRSRALGLAQDMTRELRISHGRIEADQRRMRSMLESSLDAFAAMDGTGRVTDWNAAARQMFGWTREEALGRRLIDLIAPAINERPLTSVEALLPADATHVRTEVSARHKDGRLMPTELSLARVEDDAGIITHTFMRDLSSEKEARLRELQQRKALDEARAALEHSQRLEAVGKLTGGVAHDFNNVLQIISANIQLLQHFSGNDPVLAGRLDSMMQAVDRGARLSSQLLSFARRQPLQPRVINLRNELDEMRELVRRAVGVSIVLNIHADEDLGNTLVDPVQFENVLLNLVINARDAMNGEGHLSLSLRNVTLDEEQAAPIAELRPGDYVLLTISDTGAGMSHEVIGQAFEPFFTTKGPGEGTGLGLSMAYGFVKQSGGHIALHSVEGKGTSVRIYLPRTEEAAAPLEPAPEAGSANPMPGGKETVLVVEDDPGVRSTVVSLLSGLGYTVLTANDSDQASTLLHNGQGIDLLFTDVIMPGRISSPELARQVKAMQPDAAILFTSGYAQDAIMHDGRLDPDVHLLSKPYRAEELARMVRKVLDRRR